MSVQHGNDFTITCQNGAPVDSEYSWSFKGNLIQEATGKYYTVYNASKENAGVYTCQAFANEMIEEIAILIEG